MDMIDSGRLEIGDIVQHFKRELLPPERAGSADYLYSILAVAHHTETGEPMVIYKALNGTKAIYARPMNMFISKVDAKKYPTVHQVYRFEKLAPNYEKPL